jgi:hypothetical protein
MILFFQFFQAPVKNGFLPLLKTDSPESTQWTRSGFRADLNPSPADVGRRKAPADEAKAKKTIFSRL